MARLTRAPFSRNSAVRASPARSPFAGPMRPSLTKLLYLDRGSPSLGASPARRGYAARVPAAPEPPTFMEPAKAGAVLREKLDPKTPLTVADAAAKSGLALRDAEAGLTWLSSEYRGQLRVTADGDLVHVFPTGWSQPWIARDASKKLFDGIGRGVMGVLRFVVRAWVMIVLVGYAALFLALIIGMTFANQNSDSRRSDGGLPGGELAYVLLRVLGDALFWTFHPWSPFAYGYGYGGGWNDGYASAPRPMRRRPDEPKVPLYERVNRFFFGPAAPPEDPRESERLVLAAIRAGKGRIGLADVMRVTGLPRELADPMMARLMLDYEGDVDVSDDGGIVYRFERSGARRPRTCRARPPRSRRRPGRACIPCPRSRATPPGPTWPSSRSTRSTC